MKSPLNRHLEAQQFPNEYRLVNGIEMQREFGDQFQIPPEVIKRNVRAGQFVELRIDSPRFSMHEETAETCTCPSCNGQMTNPILRHENPESLVPLPPQEVPSRGWGEDFWVLVEERSDDGFRGRVDNSLVETRLHNVKLGDPIYFHQDAILAVHGIHRQELVEAMNEADLKELVQWLGKFDDQ